jgi:hypothetical protein
VDEVPRCPVSAVADFDDLGRGAWPSGIEGHRDKHAVDGSSLGRAGPSSHARPKLVTCLGVSSVLLSRRSPASVRLFCSHRPDRGCTGGSKARPGSCFPGGPSFVQMRLRAGRDNRRFLQRFGELPIGWWLSGWEEGAAGMTDEPDCRCDGSSIEQGRSRDAAREVHGWDECSQSVLTHWSVLSPRR